MADSTVSNLQAQVVLAGTDLLHIIDDALGTPTNKKVDLNTLFANVPANTIITATLSVSDNVTFSGGSVTIGANTNHSGRVAFHSEVNVINTAIRIANTFTPASSAVSHGGKGTMFWDDTYLYMETANSTIKRIAWSTF